MDVRDETFADPVIVPGPVLRSLVVDTEEVDDTTSALPVDLPPVADLPASAPPRALDR